MISKLIKLFVCNFVNFCKIRNFVYYKMKLCKSLCKRRKLQSWFEIGLMKIKFNSLDIVLVECALR